jgi:hypothetical protein
MSYAVGFAVVFSGAVVGAELVSHMWVKRSQLAVQKKAALLLRAMTFVMLA